MKRTLCPKCGKKFKVLAAGNVTDTTSKVVRKGVAVGSTRKRVTRSTGSGYSIRLGCACKSKRGFALNFTITGKSRAKVLETLYRYSRQEGVTTNTDETVLS